MKKKINVVPEKTLLGPGSQQTFITQRVVDELQLKPLCELNKGVTGILKNTKLDYCQ